MFEAFSRPWLLLLAPLIYWLVREAFRHWQTNQWQQLLPAGLAQRLVRSPARAQTLARCPAWVLAALISCLLSFSLAGIGFSLVVEEASRQQQEVVIIQRLAPPESGQTDSVQQLQRAQQLLVPFLNNRQQGQTALIFYAGSAHLASPMTQDAATLRQVISLAHPSVMPLRGDAPEEAFQLAAETGQLAQGSGRVGAPLYWLWITDRLPNPRQLQALLDKKVPAAELLVVLTASTFSEEAVQEAESLPLRILTPQQAGHYLDQLNQPEGPARASDASGRVIFQELGHWFLLPAILLLLWQYLGQPWPRGLGRRFTLIWLLPSLYLSTLLMSPMAQALGWQSADYQAWQRLEHQPERVLQMTDKPGLQAAAWFALGEFTQAATAFEAALDDPPSHPEQLLDLQFNTGTAWLWAGDEKKALHYFDQVKQVDPEREDNCINRQLALSLSEGRPLPSEQAVLTACGAAEKTREDSASSQAASAASWQPREREACRDCLPLDPEQEQTLEQLEEDPWLLLRRRFQYELRTRQ